MARHELKTDPDVFDAVANGSKTHEIRFNDRDFKVQDTLWLRKTKHTGEEMRNGSFLEYTGEAIEVLVTHVLSGYGLSEGWVILSLANGEIPGMWHESDLSGGWADSKNEIKQPDSTSVEPRYVVRTATRHPEHLSREVFFVTKDRPHDFDASDYRNAVLFSGQPQRITEQDAREIVNSFNKWFARTDIGLPGLIDNFDSQVLSIYLRDEGHTLLAKLNEHREPDYKIIADNLLKKVKLIYEMTNIYDQKSMVRVNENKCAEAVHAVAFTALNENNIASGETK